MTPQEHQLLEFIREYTAKHQYPPSYSEMAKATGVVAKSSIHRKVKSLAAQGSLTFRPGYVRSIVLTDPQAFTGLTDEQLATEALRRNLVIGRVTHLPDGGTEFAEL